MKRFLMTVLWTMLGFALPAVAQSFEFQVEHEHTLRNCRGKLVITPERIGYQTDHKQDTRSWQYTELRQLKVLSSTSLELVTYEDQTRLAGRDRIFKFTLLAGKLTPEVSALLMKAAPRPIVTSVLLSAQEEPRFTVRVKHLRPLKGSIGTLKIYRDRIVYEASDKITESRYWRYSDLQNFSHSERYRFEIVTYEDGIGGLKAYDFQLREELPAGIYDYVWGRIYPAKFQPQEKLLQPSNESKKE
ncbi:MAG: hypothetical protein JST84_00450 [Acidobacteria bacterium]|nr:hypothetical protein [Acidobacteriota bacterium]